MPLVPDGRCALLVVTVGGLHRDETVPLVELPELPVVPMPPIPFPHDDKIPAIAEFVGARPVAWIDDAIGDAAQRWAKARQVPTVLVQIDHESGLTRPAVDGLLTWARQLT